MEEENPSIRITAALIECAGMVCCINHLPVKILLPAAVLCIPLLPYVFDRLDLSFIEPSRGSDHWLFGFLLLLLALLVAWVEYARWAKRNGA